MRISPLDIRQQQFTVKMFRGFDSHEVDAFLDDVADDYETVLKENALLKEQLATIEERSRGLAEREKAIQDTLVATQRLGDEMKAAARREAELHTREAELRGEKLLEEVRSEEAKLRSEINELRRTKRQLVEDLRSTLERYYRLMSAEFGEGGGDAPKA
jgi:cell division initiation protein